MPTENPLHHVYRTLTVVLYILPILITGSTVALATGGTMTGSGTEAGYYELKFDATGLSFSQISEL